MIEDPSMISNVVWGCIVLATILWIRQRYTTTSKIFEAWQIWVEEWYDVLSYSVLTCVLFAAWVDGNFGKVKVIPIYTHFYPFFVYFFSKCIGLQPFRSFL